MSNKATLKVGVTSEGFPALQKDAKNSADSVSRLSKQTDRYNRVQKGTAGITSNSTKAFSKMSQGLDGGLVPAYATLAANIFAVTAAFGLLQRAAAATQLEQGLIATGRAAGQNLSIVSERLKEVTQNAISTKEAMEAVAIATSAGFDEQQIVRLGEVAKGASLALGRDMTDALTRLVRGTSKLEPELLDELGIFVKLGTVTQEYADSIGVSVDSLSQFERRQAFVNAAVEQGTIKFGIMNSLVDANPYNKLAASFADLTKVSLEFLNKFFAPFAGFLAENTLALVGLFGVFASGLVKQIIPALNDAALVQKQMALASAAQATKASVVVSKAYTDAASNVSKAWVTVPPSLAKIKPAFQSGTVTAKQLQAAVQNLTKSERLRAAAIKNSTKSNLDEKKKELLSIQKLKAEIISLQKAETARYTKSAAGQRAFSQAISSNLTSRGLTEMERATSVMGKFGVAVRYSALQMNNLSGAPGLLGKITTGARAAAGAARLFGAALLSAIPVIGQLIFLGTIAFALYEKFFKKPETALSKELEVIKERLEEFPKIIEQMVTSYDLVLDRANKFKTALNPLVGLSSQVDSQIRNLIAVQKAENFAERIKAQKEINRITQEGIDLTKNLATSGRGQGTVSMTKNRTAGLVAQKQEELDALEAKPFDIESTVKSASDMLITYSASLEVGRLALEKGSSEHAFYTKAIKETDKILSKLADGSLDDATTAVRNLALSHQKAKAAMDSAAEASRNVDSFMTKAAKSTGFFESRITLLEAGLNALGKESTPEIISLYNSLTKFRGIDPLRELGVGEVLSAEEVEKFQTQAAAVLTELKAIDAATQRLDFQDTSRGLIDLNIDKKFGANSNKATLYKNQGQTLDIEDQIALQDRVLKGLNTHTDEYHKQLVILERMRLEQETLNQKRLESAASMTGSTGTRLDAAIDTKVFDEGTLLQQTEALKNSAQPMLDTLKSLGPQGEAFSQAFEGAFALSDTFAQAFATMKDGSMTVVSGLGLAAEGIAAVGSMYAARSASAVAGIDAEIAAEQKRDGVSAKSLAKIAALEARKERMKKKAFDTDKKMKIAGAVMSTAQGIASALAAPFPLNMILPAIVGAMGLAQIAAIKSTTFQGSGSVASASASPSLSVGNRSSSIDIASSRSTSGELGYLRGNSGSGGPENFRPAFTGNRATGGSTSFMVGEQGPEMFVPEVPGKIVPAGETQSMGTPITAHISIQALDSKGVDEVLSSQSGNIINMIREAANSYGETFIESVDTTTLTKERTGAARL